jgi:hypothetical protein
MADSWRPMGTGIDLTAGATYSELFQIVTENEYGDFVVQDVSGGSYSALMLDKEGGTTLATFTVDSTGAATGVLRVSMAASATALLNVTDKQVERVWGITWTRADSTVQPLIRGRCLILPKVA